MIIHTKTLPCAREKASIVIEAAMVVPLFVLLLVLFLGFFRVQMIEIQVNQALSYAVSMASMDKTRVLEEGYVSRIFLTELSEQGCNPAYIREGWKGIRLDLDESDSNVLRVQAMYQVCLPVNLFGKQYVDVTQSAVARRWNGYQSISNKDNQWVYITPQGTAYHKSSSCSYLDLSIQATDMVQITMLRNQNGGKYKACSGCISKDFENKANVVYVTDYGEFYHAMLDCGGLKRSVYRTSLDKIVDRTPCKKCYGW